MKRAVSYFIAFVVGIVVCAVGIQTFGQGSGVLGGNDSRAKQAVLTALTSSSSPARRMADTSVVADAAAKLEPAIVEIHTTGKPVQQAASPFGNDPIFRRFFGGGQSGPPVVPQGAGSGVIISTDGYILTNNHVIANTATVKVSVGENQSKEYTARVVGTDPFTDIAVLKITPRNGEPLKAAVLGDSDAVRVGDWAIAIGNPLDVGTTVTLGIISAKDRKGLQAEGSQLAGTRIQTDAAINPGNSGGALADINGRVVGINEAILSPTGSYVGIGLAIPINDAKKVAAELIKNGKVSHPYLGVQYGPLSAIDNIEARRQYGLPLNSDDGVVIGNVYPGSPAAAAGVQPGDLVLSADGTKIADRDTLNDIIQKKGVGDVLTLSVQRKGQPVTLRVTLKQRPDTFGQAQPQAEDNGQGGPDGQDNAPDNSPFGQSQP